MGKWHDKGEQDYIKGEYKPPHSSPSETFVGEITGRSEEEIEDREAYDAGWENAKKQDHRGGTHGPGGGGEDPHTKDIEKDV